MKEMRHIDTNGQFGKLAEDLLLEFEATIGTSLPEDYRAFLLKYNGGVPRQNAFSYADARGPYTDSVVRIFYGFHQGHLYRLDRTFGLSRSVIPDELLAIASDPGGNLICLGYKGKDRGKVFFLDTDGASDTDPEWNRRKLHKIANSFSSLFYLLKEE
jgi:hypothetical protein